MTTVPVQYTHSVLQSLWPTGSFVRPDHAGSWTTEVLLNVVGLTEVDRRAIVLSMVSAAVDPAKRPIGSTVQQTFYDRLGALLAARSLENQECNADEVDTKASQQLSFGDAVGLVAKLADRQSDVLRYQLAVRLVKGLFEQIVVANAYRVAQDAARMLEAESGKLERSLRLFAHSSEGSGEYDGQSQVECERRIRSAAVQDLLKRVSKGNLSGVRDLKDARRVRLTVWLAEADEFLQGRHSYIGPQVLALLVLDETQAQRRALFTSLHLATGSALQGLTARYKQSVERFNASALLAPVSQFEGNHEQVIAEFRQSIKRRTKPALMLLGIHLADPLLPPDDPRTKGGAPVLFLASGVSAFAGLVVCAGLLVLPSVSSCGDANLRSSTGRSGDAPTVTVQIGVPSSFPADGAHEEPPEATESGHALPAGPLELLGFDSVAGASGAPLWCRVDDRMTTCTPTREQCADALHVPLSSCVSYGRLAGRSVVTGVRCRTSSAPRPSLFAPNRPARSVRGRALHTYAVCEVEVENRSDGVVLVRPWNKTPWQFVENETRFTFASGERSWLAVPEGEARTMRFEAGSEADWLAFDVEVYGGGRQPKGFLVADWPNAISDVDRSAGWTFEYEHGVLVGCNGNIGFQAEERQRHVVMYGISCP